MSEHLHGPGLHVCSFHDASGSAIVNGKEWRWDFSERFGPLFLKKNGDPLKNQPCSGRHPAMKAFEAWHKELTTQRAALRR